MKFPILFLALLFLLVYSSSAKAEDNQTFAWSAEMAKIQKLPEAEQCSKTWDVLWSWSKKGDLDARAQLLLLIAPLPHMPSMDPPGPNDYAAKLRNIIIVGLHSYGNKQEWFSRSYDETLYELSSAYFSEIPAAEKFLECLKNKSQTCTEIAVKEKLIPSFEDYSKEIDAFIGAGMKPACFEGYTAK